MKKLAVTRRLLLFPALDHQIFDLRACQEVALLSRYVSGSSQRAFVCCFTSSLAIRIALVLSLISATPLEQLNITTSLEVPAL